LKIYSIIDLPLPNVQDTENGNINQFRPFENKIRAKCVTKLGDSSVTSAESKYIRMKGNCQIPTPPYHMAKSKMKYRNLNPIRNDILDIRKVEDGTPTNLI